MEFNFIFFISICDNTSSSHFSPIINICGNIAGAFEFLNKPLHFPDFITTGDSLNAIDIGSFLNP